MTKEEKLLYAIGDIDDELIMAADAPAPKNVAAFPMNKRWKKAALTAACFLLCIGVWASVGGLFRMGSSMTAESAANAKPQAAPVLTITESAEEEFDEIVAEAECTAEEAPAEAPAAKVEAATKGNDTAKCPVAEDEIFYINYQTPLLPLDISGNSEGITAERSLTIDAVMRDGESKVLEINDDYLLKNSGMEDKTVTLEYHYGGNFRTADTVSMDVDGSAAEQELDVGLSYSGFEDEGMNIHHFNNWNGMMERFPTEFISVNEAVPSYANEIITVYELYDAEIPADAPDAASIAVEFACHEDAFIWNNNFNGMGMEGNKRIYDVFARELEHHPNMSRSFWVFGGHELKDVTMKGYTNGACEVEYEGVTAKLRSYQTTLREAVGKSVWQYAEANDIDLKRIDEETLANAVLQYLKYSPLGNEPQPRYDYLNSWELNSDVLAVERIFTLRQTVTIPANSSVAISIELERPANWTLEDSRSCVDVADVLSSDLSYDSVVITLLLPEQKMIIEGNLSKGENKIKDSIKHWYVVYADAELCGLPPKE